jgi:hypothetical protein
VVGAGWRRWCSGSRGRSSRPRQRRWRSSSQPRSTRCFSVLAWTTSPVSRYVSGSTGVTRPHARRNHHHPDSADVSPRHQPPRPTARPERWRQSPAKSPAATGPPAPVPSLMTDFRSLGLEFLAHCRAAASSPEAPPAKPPWHFVSTPPRWKHNATAHASISIFPVRTPLEWIHPIEDVCGGRPPRGPVTDTPSCLARALTQPADA